MTIVDNIALYVQVAVVLALALPHVAEADDLVRIDSDMDGIADIDECLAGLDPFNPDTDGDGVLDFYDVPDILGYTRLSYGWLYTDYDYVLATDEVGWEDVFASPYRYDEHEDRDLDGWDNWSEAQVGTSLAYNSYDEPDTNGLNIAESSIADKAANFPLPDLHVTLDYNGEAISSSKLVIHAYSQSNMNGWPDAVFVKDFSEDTLDTWPMTVTVGRNELVYGHLRQGHNWFFAWLERDASALSSVNGGNWPTWSDSEPAAIADNQLDGIDIGFDLNEITFHLTDKTESFARVSWEGAISQGEGVFVNIFYSGNSVFSRTIEWPRTWLHEGDIISWNIEKSGLTGGFGLGALSSAPTVSDDLVRVFTMAVTPKSLNEAGVFGYIDPYCVISNWMHSASTLAQPVLYGPINREIVSDARPEFKFSLDQEFTEFQFTLKRVNLASGESIAIFDQRVLAPGRFWNDATGRRDLVVWHFPHSVGDRIVNGPNSYLFADGPDFEYKWEVVPYSPAIQTAQTSEGVFLTAAKETAPDAANVSGKCRIAVDVEYPSGMVALDSSATYMNTPYLRVQAFRSKSFNGLPDASIQAKTVGTYTLTGLEAGESYYIRAYIEQGGDAYARDNWESWGYYRTDGDAANPFEPVAVVADELGNSSPYSIMIQDCDTDNDLLPDAYEWTYYGDLTSLGVEDYALIVRLVAYGTAPPLVSAPVWEDHDGDGILDYYESVTASHAAPAAYVYHVAPASLLTAVEAPPNDFEGNGSVDAAALIPPLNYGESADEDLDGWNNWSEVQVFGGNGLSVTNSTVGQVAANDNSVFPSPDLSVTLDYHGKPITGAKLVIHAYTREDMNGWPDAVFVKDFSRDKLDTWPLRVTVGRGDLLYGHLRQGPNWFYAWFEENGSNLDSVNEGNWPTWNAPEPAAIADDQLDGIDIGFDLNEITFHLTDKAESFARSSWYYWMSENEDTRVSITFTGCFVFDRVIKWPRTWIHEGDIISWNNEHSGLAGASRGNYGLGALASYDHPSDNVVRIFCMDVTPQRDYEAGQWNYYGYYVISNWMHSASALAKPVLYGPIGYEIVADARPEFKFSLDPEFTEFQFILRKVENGNSTVVHDARVLAPGRFWHDATKKRDLVIFKSPLCVGDVSLDGIAFERGKTYQWQVRAYSPALKSGMVSQTSPTGCFMTANDVSYGGKGAIDVSVSYPTDIALVSNVTSSICVQAFKSKSFSGLPDASVHLCTNGTCRLAGLESGVNYYIRAFIEHGSETNPAIGESWGYYGGIAVNGDMSAPAAVTANTAGNSVAPFEIAIRDCDTDGDGISDYSEVLSGTDPGLADSDADGIANGLEEALGFDQHSAQTLRITSLSFDDAGHLALEWTWDGVERIRGANTLKTAAPYVIQAKIDLSDPEWTTILALSTDNLDGRAVLGTEGLNGEAPDVSGYRFFRVRLGTR